MTLAPDHTSSDALTHTVQLLSAAVLGAHKKETREEEYYRKHPARQKLDSSLELCKLHISLSPRCSSALFYVRDDLVHFNELFNFGN